MVNKFIAGFKYWQNAPKEIKNKLDSFILILVLFNVGFIFLYLVIIFLPHDDTYADIGWCMTNEKCKQIVLNNPIATYEQRVKLRPIIHKIYDEKISN